MSERRAFLLGLDGLPPATFHRFVREGAMPRFARLLQRAAELDAIPTLPPTTAPGWLSIASGAHPGTIGVDNILLSTPGCAPDVVRNGFDSRRSRAEYLWEALDRQGLDAIVLKYPGSWPPRAGGFVQVDGAGGYADITCRFDLAPSQAYVSHPAHEAEDEGATAVFPSGYDEHWRVDTGTAAGLAQVTARDPVGWRGLEPRDRPAFEVVVRVTPRGGPPFALHALALRRAGTGVPELLLARRKDAAAAVRVVPGGWSPWMRARAVAGDFAFRFKLLELDLDSRTLHLYRSEGHRLDGFTQPPALAHELVAALGPVVEWTGTYDLMNGLIDLDTQLELYEQHTEWMAGAIRHLAGGGWDGFFTHWHVIEYAHHIVGASLHAEHPLHRPELVERDLDFLRRTYALADRLLAAVEDVIDDDTLLVVASDHGHDLVHTVFHANHLLMREGLLATRHGPRGVEVDWERTVAYALFPGYVFLNSEERWPGGTLAPRELPGIAAWVSAALREARDPRTGCRPVKVVLTREELRAYGIGGLSAPDLCFCLERGYETASRIAAGDAPAPLFEVSVPYREVTSGHGSFLPASPSARTLALFAHPTIVAVRPPHPVPVIDIAPTIAAFLGIEPPRQCDGRPLAIVPEAVPA